MVLSLYLDYRISQQGCFVIEVEGILTQDSFSYQPLNFPPKILCGESVSVHLAPYHPEGLNTRSWVPQIQGAAVGFGLAFLCFSCPTVRCRGALPHGFQPWSLAAPARMQETWGDLREDHGRAERKGEERVERKHPFASLKPLSSFKVEKKNPEGGEGGRRGRNFPATSLLSAHCKLPVAASLAPALLSPLASAPKFLTTLFPAGNVNQDTFRIEKKNLSKNAPFSFLDYVGINLVVLHRL